MESRLPEPFRFLLHINGAAMDLLGIPVQMPRQSGKDQIPRQKPAKGKPHGLEPFLSNTAFYIEAYPTAGSSCIFPPAEIQKSPQKPDPPDTGIPAVYVFDDIDQVIEGAMRLFAHSFGQIEKSALYRLGEHLFLEIFSPRAAQNRILSILDEYASRWGTDEAAAVWIEEHASPVMEEHAVDLLCAYFG